MNGIDDLKPEDVTSEGLAELHPQTDREHLMVMWLTQQRIVKHLEDLNGWRKEASPRLSYLEGAFSVAGVLVAGGLIMLALKVVFGG